MLKIAKEEGRYIVELFQVNKLNTLFSEIVEKQLIELVVENDESVVFNLDGVSFIDSCGFDTLLTVADRARELGKQFSLGNVTEEVRELICLLELEERFSCCTCRNMEEKILVGLD